MDSLRYVGIDAAVEEYISMTGIRGSARDRQMYKKAAEDIVRELNFKEHMTHKIKLFEVEDNCIELPDNFAILVQALYRRECDNVLSTIHVKEWMTHMYDCKGCEFKIRKECPTKGEREDVNTIEIEATPQMLNAHPQFGAGGDNTFLKDYGGASNKQFKPPLPLQEFNLLRPAQHNFFNADWHIRGCLNLDQRLRADETVPEYRIDFPFMYVNFDRGQILLSYLEYKTDEDGYRLIPDLPDVFEAIRWGIRQHDAYKDFLKTQNQVWLRDSENAASKKLLAMRRARSTLKMMDFDKWWSVMENQYMKMHRYYNWYENMNRYKEDPYTNDMNRLNLRNGGGHF